MSYLVSARKYRPQQFDEVIGQEHITGTLKAALAQEKLAHAFLFTGPRGVGKTTCARILAKVINCENVKDSKSCDECSSCQAFFDNASFNIIELDAASHNSVDHMRMLNEQVRFQPQHGRYKVFIIDEVHMLSSSAFNAFLKTLEEPPPYAIFILATTEKHKIIPTILSRCQIFDFKRIQIPDIQSQLKSIAKNEKIEMDEQALFTIAEKADGALRDALSIFDRIVSSTEGKVKYQDVLEKLNILDYDYYFKVSDALLREDHSDTLILFDEILKNGFEGDYFINGLAEHFRKLLLCKDPSTFPLLEMGEELRMRYKHQAEIFTISNLMTCLDLANQCDIHYPRAKNKALHVEICLLKMAFLNRLIQRELVVNPGTEKKTLNEKPESQTTTEDQKKPAKASEPEPQLEKPEDPPIKENSELEKKEQEESDEAEGEIEEEVETDEDPAPDHSLQNTPSLVSIDEVISEVKSSNEGLVENSAQLNLEEVEEIWAEYQEEVSSPSIKSVLAKAILNLEKRELIVDVPSQVAKDMILQESLLIQEIRSRLQAPDLNLAVNIDKEKFPELESTKPKEYLTVKEKYDHMSEKNPKLKELIKQLDLKIDHDYT